MEKTNIELPDSFGLVDGKEFNPSMPWLDGEQWVSCKERMPEDYGLFLVSYKSRKQYRRHKLAYYTPKGWVFPDKEPGWKLLLKERVTHWMSLPLHPKD